MNTKNNLDTNQNTLRKLNNNVLQGALAEYEDILAQVAPLQREIDSRQTSDLQALNRLHGKINSNIRAYPHLLKLGVIRHILNKIKDYYQFKPFTANYIERMALQLREENNRRVNIYRQSEAVSKANALFV